MTFSFSHRSSTMSRCCQTVTFVVVLAVVSLVVGTNVMCKLGTDASARPSRASSALAPTNLSFRPSVSTGRQRPGPATVQASVAVLGPRLATKLVILYGDSLAWEARVPFSVSLALGGVNQVLTRTFGGTAICDWLPQMRADEAQLRPDAVVIEFSGNALTSCMLDPDGHLLTGDDYFGKYADGALTAIGIFASDDTQVFLAGSPISEAAAQTHDPGAERLDLLYESIAGASRNAHYINAGAAVLDHGHWTDTLACLPEEPCTGGTDASGRRVNIVRAPDGRHFCPEAPPAIGGVTDSCPVWSSGAYRYGSALATPVLLDLWRIGGPTVATKTIDRSHAGRGGTTLRREVAMFLTVGREVR